MKAIFSTTTTFFLFVNRYSRRHHKLLLSKMSTTKNDSVKDEFDEFGNMDSVLANFDVDRAVQEHDKKMSNSPDASAAKRQLITTTMSIETPKNDGGSDDSAMDKILASVDIDAIENEAKKKRKVSPSPKSSRSLGPSSVFPFTPIEQQQAVDDPEQAEGLRKTLRDVFGYSDFRSGQLEVIQTLLPQKNNNINKKAQDVSVYWATGKGKSLCYQIPALYSKNQVALVVSPLISLMQDQCHKLNALSAGPPLAAYLGSAQVDANIEEQAWAGAFRVVYLTPEKLTSSLDRMVQLHTTSGQNKNNNNGRGIALIAIDEAHTVSEWGTDFRPDFRKLSIIRDQATLRDIPILTLTATAVPRVQQDIATVLQLRQPLLISKQSLDRKNLRLAIHNTRSNNPASALQDYIRLWNDTANCKASQQSTIIYVATRNQVDQVTAALQQCITNPNIRVAGYHAGHTPQARHEAHTQFLTGQTAILVATVAFGMGIDKPDTRRIIHYGPPKTMEEYYQQIGRAGRDGAPAEAVMYTTGKDFDKYQEDFYVGSLPPEARKATLESLHALKDYALSKSKCRRHALLSYFGEVPTFEYCRRCDICQEVESFGDDLERDFSDLGALTILEVVASLKEQGLTQIMKVLGGKAVEPFRCRVPVQALQQNVERARQALPRKVSIAYFEQLLNLLLQKQYLVTKQIKATIKGYHKSWMVYELTTEGRKSLNQRTPIRLPVPDYLRDLERKDEERRQEVLAALQKTSFKDRIPSDELEQGDGEVIRAYSKWQNYVETARGMGRTERVELLENLLSAIEDWRSEMATKYQMAPVGVMQEHILASLAYTVATLPPGTKMDSASLIAVGVRSKEIDSLVQVLGQWSEKAQPKSDVPGGDDTHKSTMILPEIPTRTPWRFANYKPYKKTGVAVWEQSYNRYAEGESVQAIAMHPGSGRQPIQAKSVAGHIMDAIVHGRAVGRLDGIVAFFPPPTRAEWEKLEATHVLVKMDPVGDPETSGKDGGKYFLTDAIRPIVGRVADIPFNERSDADKGVLAHWYDLLKWYLALKRGHIQPQFQ